MDCHSLLQAIFLTQGLNQVSCLTGRFFTIWPIREVLVVVVVLVAQSCLTLCSSPGCSSPGSSVCRILQARMGEWIDVPFSRGSSWPRDQTWVFCTAGRFFTIKNTHKMLLLYRLSRVRLCETPETAALQAPPFLGLPSNTGVGCHFLFQSLSKYLCNKWINSFGFRDWTTSVLPDW